MKGFTLIEVLVVTVITVAMASTLVLNFSKSRISVGQASLLVQDAVREAQTLALTGALWKGAYRCGYGIHFEADRFTVFAGPSVATGGGCAVTDTRTVSSGVVVRTALVPDPALEFVPVSDIYFEPPNSVVYFGGVQAAGTDVRTVTVKKKGTTGCAASTCRQVSVNAVGLVSVLSSPQP